MHVRTMRSEGICGDGQDGDDCHTSAFILSELINIPITFMIEEQHLKRKMHLPGQRWSNNI